MDESATLWADMVASAKTSDSSDSRRSAQADQVNRLRAAAGTMLKAGDGEGAIAALLDVIVSLQDDNERLLSRLNTAIRSRYGRRSEKLNAEELGQLLIAFGGTPEQAEDREPNIPTPPVPEEDTEPESPGEGKKKPKRKRRKGRNKTVVNNEVRRIIVPIPVPEGQRDCIHCGTEMSHVGHVDHESIEFHPARFELIVRRCEKIACKQCKQDICSAPDISAEQARALVAASVRKATEVNEVAADATPSTQTAEADSVNPEVLPDAAPKETTAPTEGTPAQKPDGETSAPATGPRRRAGVSLLAHLIESKCDDALPIYRQRDQFSRSGVTFPLNTLYSYWMAALAIVSPIAEVLLSAVLGSDIVGVDDTKLDFLDPDARSRRQRGHLWCFASHGPLIAFDFTKTWCAEDIKPRLSAIDGFVQCDDYKGYGVLVDRDDGGPPQPLVAPDRRLGCTMHVRRRFHKAFKNGEKDAIIAMGHIKTIYEVEAEAKEKGLDYDGRLHLRQDKSMQPLGRLYEWVDAQYGKLRPTSYLSEAVNYARVQRPFIERCFTDGRFEIDNGRVEREIKKPAIGRKNYLFSGSPKAATLLAGGYSLVGSCRHLGIPTRDYLVDAITRLEAGFPLRRINELRPDLWAVERGLIPSANYLAQQPAEHSMPR
jgi:transposase